ncbi:E3 ubiquitin-protein ligase BRE1 [Termitomyces sp. T112]|nr:E3 ubiquitin-protein ligase BRE1 [Termitomyces sp. T112]
MSALAPATTPRTTEVTPTLLSSTKSVPVLPLTPEGFAPFGKVIQGYTDLYAAPKGIQITPANAGSAYKFHKLCLIESSYPAEANNATSGISIYRCQPCKDITNDGYIELKVLERHPFTNQVFIPMGPGTGEGIRDPGLKYLVVVAHNGTDDRPDPDTLRAFVASAAQGIAYNTGVWHQPMAVLEKEMDFACVETQIGDGSIADCEIVELADNDVVSAVVSVSLSKLMEVSRKRPHVDNEDFIATKKRALAGRNGSPQVNGMAKEEFDADNLELFRKEAIYRRMKHYSRENERCQSLIEDLEKRKQSCEVGLAAMTACWNHLIKTIRLLVRSNDSDEVAEQMFDFTVRIQEDKAPDITKALEVNLKATENLVTRLFEAGGNTQTPLPAGSTLDHCQKEISDRISLQTQLDLAHTKLRDAEELKEKYHRDLQMAESRLDRYRSQTVAAMHTHTPEQRSSGAEDAIEDSQRKPSSPAEPRSPAQHNGIGVPKEVDILRAQVASREARISELEQDVASATLKRMMLETELKQMSHERIVENPHYKSLLEQAGVLQASLTASRAEITRLSEESNHLRASRIEWEENLISAANQANQELKIMLGKRDAENSRLREQREQQAAELVERRQQDNVKTSSLREMKALNDSRLERIATLESEVARAKARLAANMGDEDLMKFFLEGQTHEAEYFTSLKERAVVAEQRVSILEHSLSKYQDAHPDIAEHLKAEADALQRLADVQAQLEKYKRVYGDASGLPPDTSALAEQLRRKEEEVHKLRLQDTQHTQAETSLYTELEKLSTAWESLERQVKEKVFDLGNLENQLKKATSEKAKSDNKYYAAMRDKDAVSAETTRLQRNVEKQNKVVERLVDAEKNLTAQLSNLEKELAAIKTVSLVYKEKAETLDISVAHWSRRYEAEHQRVNEVHVAYRELEKLNSAKHVELRKMEDGIIRARKELDAKIKQQESAASQSGGSENAKLLRLLKCSACEVEFRDTVITKCLHTFCRPCIDARISTRQRKCPACGLGFAQSDVLYGLYFQ